MPNDGSSPWPRRTVLLAGLVDLVGVLWAGSFVITGLQFFIERPDLAAGGWRLNYFPEHEIVLDTVVVAVSVLTMALATLRLAPVVRSDFQRARAGLVLGVCSAPGPLVLLWSMHTHRAGIEFQLMAGGGAVALLVANGLPAALWWRNLNPATLRTSGSTTPGN